MERLFLHDLATGETTELTRAVACLRTLAARPLLLREGESLSDLEQLKSTWAEAFPGDTGALAALRHNLIRAHWHLLRAQAAAETAALRLHLAPETPAAPRIVHFLERQSTATERAFTRQLTTLRAWRKDALALELATLHLRAAQTAAETTAAKTKPKQEQEAPPPEPPPSETFVPAVWQGVHVKTNADGAVTTTPHPTNADTVRLCRLAQEQGKDQAIVHRELFFPTGIPEPYRWPCLSSFDPAKQHQSILLEYGLDEFIRLAEYESAYNPEFLVPEPPPDFGDQTIVPFTRERK
jgi:hypothetical protein